MGRQRLPCLYRDSFQKLICKSCKQTIQKFHLQKREPPYTVGGDVNWYSRYGKQYGGGLKN